MAADEKKSLEAIRQRIDEIDDAILALLGERMQAVYDVRAAKAGLPNGPTTAMRPGREAEILRRLVAARQMGLPADMVARLWRELISSATRIQGAVTLHIADTGAAGEISDLAREHFGAGGRMIRHSSSDAALDAVGDKASDVAVLPMGAQGNPNWVDHLLARPSGTLQVIAALPFVSDDDTVRALVLGHADVETTGDDSTVVAVKSDRAGDPVIVERLKQEGLTALFLASGEDWGLYSVSGLLKADDERLARVLSDPGVDELRIAGAYANPIHVAESG